MNAQNVKTLDAFNTAITAAMISNGKMKREMLDMKTKKECYSIPIIRFIGACCKVQKMDSFIKLISMNQIGRQRCASTLIINSILCAVFAQGNIIRKYILDVQVVSKKYAGNVVISNHIFLEVQMILTDAIHVDMID